MFFFCLLVNKKKHCSIAPRRPSEELPPCQYSGGLVVGLTGKAGTLARPPNLNGPHCLFWLSGPQSTVSLQLLACRDCAGVVCWAVGVCVTNLGPNASPAGPTLFHCTFPPRETKSVVPLHLRETEKTVYISLLLCMVRWSLVDTERVDLEKAKVVKKKRRRRKA